MLVDDIFGLAIAYNKNDVTQSNHLIKVFSFAHHIGIMEKCDRQIQDIIDIAAILHDIGIKEAIRKHNSSAGNWQEIEGPMVAKDLLKELNIDENTLERVLFIIGHHHSYDVIDGMDFQILVEADFLVNIFENEMDKSSIQKVAEEIFKTESGKKLLTAFYL